MSPNTESKQGAFLRVVGSTILVLGFIGGMLWLSGFFDMVGASLKPNRAFVDDTGRPPLEDGSTEYEAPTPDSKEWSCGWAPTMNENWHDDVLCSNGLNSMRPTLLPNQGFVTKVEMMQAARQYEIGLNG